MKNLVSTIKQLSPLYKKWVSFYYESPCIKKLQTSANCWIS